MLSQRQWPGRKILDARVLEVSSLKIFRSVGIESHIRSDGGTYEKNDLSL